MFPNGWPRKTTPDFINIVLHPKQEQRIIEEAGYIPLN
jgi:ABC-type phosphate transport system substrate-binding protein